MTSTTIQLLNWTAAATLPAQPFFAGAYIYERTGIAYGTIDVGAPGDVSIPIINGLQNGVLHYLHAVLVTDWHRWSNVGSSTGILTTNADVTAPVLSGGTWATTSASTATLTIRTNEGNGILYYTVGTVLATPTIQEIKTGKMAGGAAALVASSISNPTPGTDITINLTGLASATTYRVWFWHQDVAGNPTNPTTDLVTATGSAGSTATVDGTTAATLSGGTITNVSASGCTIAVNTNRLVLNGSLYYVITGSSTVPTAAQILAGTDHANVLLPSGSPAGTANRQNKATPLTTITSNPQTSINISNLTAGFVGYVYWLEVDDLGNQSAVYYAGTFSTVSTVAVTSNTMTAFASATGSTFSWTYSITPKTASRRLVFAFFHRSSGTQKVPTAIDIFKSDGITQITSFNIGSSTYTMLGANSTTHLTMTACDFNSTIFDDTPTATIIIKVTVPPNMSARVTSALWCVESSQTTPTWINPTPLTASGTASVGTTPITIPAGGAILAAALQGVMPSTGISTGTLVGGSNYSTPATYNNVVLSTSGSGTGALATIVVSGGAVTGFTVTRAGTGYAVSDVMTAADGLIGGRVGGSAFTWTITALGTSQPLLTWSGVTGTEVPQTSSPTTTGFQTGAAAIASHWITSGTLTPVANSAVSTSSVWRLAACAWAP